MWTAPLAACTIMVMANSGSMVHTAVVPQPSASAIPRATASFASGKRTGTTLSKPDSDSDCMSIEASASASSLQVSPMDLSRSPRVAASASLRSTAAVASSEFMISTASWSMVKPSTSLPSTRTRPMDDGVMANPSTASTQTTPSKNA